MLSGFLRNTLLKLEETNGFYVVKARKALRKKMKLNSFRSHMLTLKDTLCVEASTPMILGIMIIFDLVSSISLGIAYF